MRFPLSCALLLLSSCAAQDGPLIVAHFALEVPESAVTADELLLPTGHFNLQAFPAFVQAKVSAIGMESARQTWPEETGEISTGSNPVYLEFDLPAGSGQELTAVAYTYEEGRPYAYAPPAPEILELAEGDTLEVDLELVETSTGQVSGLAGDEAAEAWLVDLETKVRIDTLATTDGLYRFDYAPRGRKLAVAWMAADGSVLAQSADIFLTAETPTAIRDMP